MPRWIVSAWIVAALGCQSVPSTTPIAAPEARVEKTLGDFDCPAPAVGVIAGAVVTPDRKPIPGAAIRLLASEDLTIQVVTDEHGEFVIPCLYPGPGFEVEVDAAGFRTAKRTFEVDKSKPTRLLIVAEPK